MVEKSYFDDPFLKCFVSKTKIPRRSSLINRGYYLRSKVVRSVVQNFIEEMPERKQLISLGAGFDTTYFCLRQEHDDINSWKFVEIDYPDVIERKLTLAKFHKLFADTVVEKTIKIFDTNSQSSYDGQGDGKSANDVKTYRCGNYLAFGFDLRNVGGALTKVLTDNGVDQNQETLFLSEVVLTYVTGSQSTKVFNWIGVNFPNAMTLVFEQMLPHDSFGQVMQRHFKSIGSPLLSIDAFPTLASQIKRHLKAGFGVYSHSDLHSSFCKLPVEERNRIENLEMFDEFEGWHQMCLHYFVLCTTNSSLAHLRKFCLHCFKWNYSDSDKPSSICIQKLTPVNHKPAVEELNLYGHSMCSYDGNKKILILGGFGAGKEVSNHRRLNFVSSVDLRTDQVTTYFNIEIKQAMFSTIAKFSNPEDGFEVFVVFGGRAAPNQGSNQMLFFQVEKCGDSKKIFLNADFCSNLSTIELPPPRWRHTATVYPSRDVLTPSQMLVIGGRDERTVLCDCWIFNFFTRNWTKLELHSKCCENFPSRHSHSAVWWKSKRKLVISGGLSESSQPFNDILLLDPYSSLFEKLKIESMLPRYSHSSHILRDRLLCLVGGVVFPAYSDLLSSVDSVFDHILIVDLVTLTVIRRVDFPPTFENNPIRVHCHTSLLQETENGECELTIIGGGSNCFSFGTAFTKTPLRFILRIPDV